MPSACRIRPVFSVSLRFSPALLLGQHSIDLVALKQRNVRICRKLECQKASQSAGLLIADYCETKIFSAENVAQRKSSDDEAKSGHHLPIGKWPAFVFVKMMLAPAPVFHPQRFTMDIHPNAIFEVDTLKVDSFGYSACSQEISTAHFVSFASWVFFPYWLTRKLSNVS